MHMDEQHFLFLPHYRNTKKVDVQRWSMINTTWQKGMRVSMGAFCNSISVQCIQMYGHLQLQGSLEIVHLKWYICVSLWQHVR